MASEQCVERVLKAVAAMFNKHPLWVQDSQRMWSIQLEDYNDRQVIIGCKDLLRKAKKLPSVAQLRDVIEANPASAPKPKTFQGCRACRGTGMRELARWYFDDHDRIQVFTGVAACDCAKGARLAMGAFPDWRDVVQQWEQNPATTTVYYGTVDAPVLTEEQRLTAEERQRRADLRAKFARSAGPASSRSARVPPDGQ